MAVWKESPTLITAFRVIRAQIRPPSSCFHLTRSRYFVPCFTFASSIVDLGQVSTSIFRVIFDSLFPPYSSFVSGASRGPTEIWGVIVRIS